MILEVSQEIEEPQEQEPFPKGREEIGKLDEKSKHQEPDTFAQIEGSECQKRG